MEKVNIIQFMPYFPPHKGGLETVGEEIGINWEKSNLGGFLNVITSFNQEDDLEKNEKIIFEGEIIGYKKNNIIHLVIPSFEIINNFPMYKFLDKKTKLIFKYLGEFVSKNQNIRVITHTRFFLPSLFGGIFARNHNLKWVHIEHGSDYVKLGSQLKSKISYIYDRLIGKWIFKNADKIVAISEACKNFINNEFIKREVSVFYRGLDIIINKDLEVENLKYKFPDKIIIGFVGRILKWKNVDSLINAYYELNEDIKNKIQIVVVGDGEELKNLKNLDSDAKIYFTGSKIFDEAILLQSQFDIHFHTSSPGGGLATTLLQAMHLGCFIIATPYEGAPEVIENGINGILLNDDKVETFKKGIIKALENIDKKEEFSKLNKEIIENRFERNENIEKYYNLIK